MRHHLQIAGRARGVRVTSAGTVASRVGARPDQRVRKVAAEAGIKLGRIKVSRVSERELIRSDFVFAMDHRNLESLLEICPCDQQYKIRLLLSHLPGRNQDEVPDPYYGSYQGFEEVFQIIETAVLGLISQEIIFA